MKGPGGFVADVCFCVCAPACACDLQGSRSSQCDDLGRCPCKPGFQGVKCQASGCPACFSSVKMKVSFTLSLFGLWTRETATQPTLACVGQVLHTNRHRSH